MDERTFKTDVRRLIRTFSRSEFSKKDRGAFQDFFLRWGITVPWFTYRDGDSGDYIRLRDQAKDPGITTEERVRILAQAEAVWASSKPFTLWTLAEIASYYGITAT
jgi:hypothetical protein